MHSISLLVFIYLVVVKYQDGFYGTAFFFFVFGLIPLISLFKIITNRPTVEINEKGIRNNTNMMGLIEWQYIDHFEIKKIIGRNILVIHLTDAKEALKKKKPIAKALMNTNTKKLGSPVAIGEMEFNQPLEEVIPKIEILKNLYKK